MHKLPQSITTINSDQIAEKRKGQFVRPFIFLVNTKDSRSKYLKRVSMASSQSFFDYLGPDILTDILQYPLLTALILKSAMCMRFRPKNCLKKITRLRVIQRPLTCQTLRFASQFAWKWTKACLVVFFYYKKIFRCRRRNSVLTGLQKLSFFHDGESCGLEGPLLEAVRAGVFCRFLSCQSLLGV